MTKQEMVNELKLAQKLLEWEYPMTIAVAIDEAIKIILEKKDD